MKLIKYLFTVILTLTCLSGCNEEESAINTNEEASQIQTLIEDGSLLKKITWDDDIYTLTFETGTVEIPTEIVESVNENYEKWNTILTFNNKQEISIPSLGNNINNTILSTKLNPSEYNPLAANVFVAFPAKGRAKIIIHGKEGSHGTVEYLFNNWGENQNLTILGLYPDYDNKVSVIMTDKKGNERARTQITIKTKPLDITSLPVYVKIKKASFDKMEPGMTLLSDPGASEADTSCPYMLDADGEIRWVLDWRTSPDLRHIGAQCGLHRLENGNYLAGDANNHQIAEVNILGEVVRKWDLKALGYNFHHDALIGNDGKLLIAATKLDAKLTTGKSRIYDHIIEMGTEGTIDREWDLTNILDSARYTPIDPTLPGASYGQTQGNWAHNNALLPWGDDYLASARYQGVFKFHKNGELAWVIAPHKNWRRDYQKYLLTPLDKEGNEITDSKVISGEKSSDAFDWPWGQHTPVIMPNGHILMFDNGYCRNFISKAFTEPGQYSRIVEYEVDETNRTVRQVWEYGREREDCYAAAMSSVQYLPETKHVLFCPGMGNKLSNGSYGGHIIEINPLTKEIISEIEICTNFHRATRLSLYPKGL